MQQMKFKDASKIYQHLHGTLEEYMQDDTTSAKDIVFAIACNAANVMCAMNNPQVAFYEFCQIILMVMQDQLSDGETHGHA